MTPDLNDPGWRSVNNTADFVLFLKTKGFNVTEALQIMGWLKDVHLENAQKTLRVLEDMMKLKGTEQPPAPPAPPEEPHA